MIFLQVEGETWEEHLERLVEIASRELEIPEYIIIDRPYDEMISLVMIGIKKLVNRMMVEN